MRWRDYSVVMQSAMNALNPMKSIGAQFKDTLQAHGSASGDEIRTRSVEVMNLVGIDAAHLASYPHQLSGGMRQRAMIAMALLFTPQLVIMDEPTSALDVVAQRSLMTKIKDLQRSLGFAVIFVTHDMSVVSRYSRPRAGHVRRPGRRGGRDRGDLRAAAAPVHPRLDERVPVGHAARAVSWPESRAHLQTSPGRPEAVAFTRAAPRSCRRACSVEPDLYAVGRGSRSLPPLRRAGQGGGLSDGRASQPGRDRDGCRRAAAADGRPHAAFPARRHVLQARCSTRSTTSTSRSGSARSWPWSERAAAARARWPGCWPGSTRPPAARSTTGAGRCTASARARTCSGTAGRCRWSSRTRSARCNPVFRVSHGVMRNLALHRPDLGRRPARAGGRARVRERRPEPQDAHAASPTR